MTVQTKTQPNHFTQLEQELIERAHEVGRFAESELKNSEENATVSQEFVNKLVESGLTRIMLPREYNEPQISLRAFGEIIRTISYYNVSAGWLGYLYPLHNSLPAHLPRAGRDEIVRQGGLIVDVFAPVGQAEVVENGVRITGTYNYASGVIYADWIGLGVFVQLPECERPEFCMVFVPKSEAEVNINWDTFGLRGSGSNQVVVNNVFVPRNRILRLEVANETRRPPEDNYDQDYPFYHVPFFSAFYIGFPHIALGGAKRLLEEFKIRTEKRVRIDGTSEKETPRAQRVLAELTLKYKSANGLMEQYFELLDTYETEGPFPRGEFAAIRAEIIKICTDIAAKVMLTLGGAALMKNDTIEVFLRDMYAVATHTTSLYEDALSSYGRNLFGYEGMGFG